MGGEPQGAWPSCSYRTPGCWVPGLALPLLPGCAPSRSLPGGLAGWRAGALVDTLPGLLHSGRPPPCKPPAFLGGGFDPETLARGVHCPCGQVHLLDNRLVLRWEAGAHQEAGWKPGLPTRLRKDFPAQGLFPPAPGGLLSQEGLPLVAGAPGEGRVSPGVPVTPTLGLLSHQLPESSSPEWLEGSRVAGLTSASLGLAQGWGCQTSLWSGSLSHGGSQAFPGQAGWAPGCRGRGSCPRRGVGAPWEAGPLDWWELGVGVPARRGG